MNRYFINGASCEECTARNAFYQHMYRMGFSGPYLKKDWELCQVSEESRDALLPSHIEIIQE